MVEEAIQMICDTGGVAVLAHPWALKNPIPIVRRLKEAGLHGMEVYKSDGRLAGKFSHLFNDNHTSWEVLFNTRNYLL